VLKRTRVLDTTAQSGGIASLPIEAAAPVQPSLPGPLIQNASNSGFDPWYCITGHNPQYRFPGGQIAFTLALAESIKPGNLTHV